MFGEVKKEPKLLENFGVTKTPTLMVVTDPSGFKGETYEMTDIKVD